MTYHKSKNNFIAQITSGSYCILNSLDRTGKSKLECSEEVLYVAKDYLAADGGTTDFEIAINAAVKDVIVNTISI